MILVAETAVTNTHLFTSRVNIVDRLAANEPMLLAHVIGIGQAVAAVVTVKTEPGASDFGSLFEIVARRKERE